MKYVLISILFFAFASPLQSQGLIVAEKTQLFKFDFRYENMSPPESLPNDIIHKMALIQAPTRDYFFGFSLYEKSQIIKLKQNKYRISLKADSINYYNKLSYQGYKLNGCVFPNELKFNIQIENANTKQAFLITTKAPFNLSNSALFDTIFTDTTGQGFFIISHIQIQCSFTKEQAIKLDSSLTVINQLAALEPELKLIRSKLQSFQNIKAGMVQIYNIDLKTIEEDLQRINPKKLLSNDLSLELKKEGSLALYDSLVALTRKTRKHFNHMIDMPEYEYYSEGYHALQQGKTEIAKSYFLKSISQKPSYPPPFYALAELAFKNQDWDSCARTIFYILHDLDPDFTIRKNTLILGSKLYKTITYKAENMILTSQVNEAIQLLYIANNLCVKINELVCNGDAELLLKKAKSDLFYSWISITDKSIMNNKVDLSLNYLGWTQEYYRENRQYLDKSPYLDTLKIRLIHILILNASAKNNSGYYQKAIDYINLADSLCSITHYHECESDLQKVKVKSYSGLYNKLMRKSKAETISKSSENQMITKATTLKKEHPEWIVLEKDSLDLGNTETRYKNLISQGLIYLNTGIFHKAAQNFDEALNLESMAPIATNDSLMIYLRMANKPLILNDLKSGDLKAWGMHYQAVNTIIRIAREEALKVGLENDSEIVVTIKRLEELAFDNQCAEASTQYTKNLQTASENMRFHDFLSAAKNWDAAIDLAHKNPQCNMDINLPLTQKQKYFTAIQYQNQISESKKLIAAGKDSLAFEQFLYTYKHYNSDTLASFDLLKITPNQFTKNQNSTELQYFNLKWILDNPIDESILEDIQNLTPYYNEKAKYSELLKRAVRTQAQIDKKSGNSFSPKTRAEKLFTGNKSLIKEYLRSYRKG